MWCTVRGPAEGAGRSVRCVFVCAVHFVGASPLSLRQAGRHGSASEFCLRCVA